jgi:hypothetical protein
MKYSAPLASAPRKRAIPREFRYVNRDLIAIHLHVVAHVRKCDAGHLTHHPFPSDFQALSAGVFVMWGKLRQFQIESVNFVCGEIA